MSTKVDRFRINLVTVYFFFQRNEVSVCHENGTSPMSMDEFIMISASYLMEGRTIWGFELNTVDSIRGIRAVWRSEGLLEIDVKYACIFTIY